jgi:hypothetical protein
VVSGYFDDLKEAAAHAEAWSGKAPGVYFTLNPVEQSLLSRRKNRLETHAKATTADDDIRKRRWLLLDFDPERPTGISATDAEHDLAIVMAKKCRLWLKSFGWPNPVFADSGNGAHLLYRVSLPNDPKSKELIEQVTQSVSFRLSDDAVDVDLKTCNAARITKVYGTLAAKGDNTSERPHRYSKLVTVPKPIHVVASKLLKKVAALLPKSEPSADVQVGKFDLEKWIAEHHLSVAQTGDWNGGRKWVLEICPWNPEHTNRSAYIVRLANGAIGAGCHHNGCSGQGWQALRDVVDPGWRDNRKAKRPDASKTPDAYLVKDGCITHARLTRDGHVEVPLCNFSAQIVEQTTEDDGVERKIRLAIDGTLAAGITLARADVSASDYAGMSWIVPAWGTHAVVYAGMNTKDHLRAAIQLLSGDVPACIVYTHLGWRQINDQWVYLHVGGAIGSVGPVGGTQIKMPNALVNYVLPDPPEGAELLEAIRASLAVLDLGPARITAPVLGAVYRVELGPTDYAVHLAGPTGTYKTELAALAQQHFGASMDARHLPGSWSSSGNSLEDLAFIAKDALLVVDDFAPNGSVYDVARYHREADRVFRAQGNRAGRGRSRPDGSVRPAHPPRGSIISTGEDVPRGQSLRARLLVIDIGPGDLGPPLENAKLRLFQQAAANGLYAQALAGYVRWLAPRIATIRAKMPGRLTALRGELIVSGAHARTPGIVAELLYGWRLWTKYALDVGAINSAQRRELLERVRKALLEAAALQAAHVQAAAPGTSPSSDVTQE